MSVQFRQEASDDQRRDPDDEDIMSLLSRATAGTALFGAALAGCYQSPHTDCTIPCGSDGRCPVSFSCNHGYCTQGAACASDGSADAFDDAATGMDVDADANADPDAPPVACAWRKLQTDAPRPSARAQAGAAYDAEGNRMLLLNGTGEAGPLSDLWSLSLDGNPVWTELMPAGPSPVGGLDTFVDQGRLVAFQQAEKPVVWTLDLAAPNAWNQTQLTGPPNGSTIGAATVLDVPNHRLVLFGGGTEAGLATNGTSAVSLAPQIEWGVLMPPIGAPPPPTFRSAAIYDRVGYRMVVFQAAPTAVWGLLLTTPPAWTALAPSGGGAQHTFLRGPLVYDPHGPRALVFGNDMALPGQVVDAGAPDADTTQGTWTLSLSSVDSPTWSQLPTSGVQPDPRTGHAMIYDVVSDRLIVFGGQVFGVDDGLEYLDDLWTLDLGPCR